MTLPLRQHGYKPFVHTVVDRQSDTHTHTRTHMSLRSPRSTRHPPSPVPLECVSPPPSSHDDTVTDAHSVTVAVDGVVSLALCLKDTVTDRERAHASRHRRHTGLERDIFSFSVRNGRRLVRTYLLCRMCPPFDEVTRDAQYYSLGYEWILRTATLTHEHEHTGGSTDADADADVETRVVTRYLATDAAHDVLFCIRHDGAIEDPVTEPPLVSASATAIQTNGDIQKTLP